MPEFRIGSDALKRGRLFSVLSWGTVLLLIMFATVLFVLHYFGRIRDDSTVEFLFVLTTTSAAILAIILAPREGLRRAEREMVFVLDDKRIVRRRSGWPDVVIDFSEIETLREELRWLIVISAEPRRKIAIPRSVSGYELVLAEISKQHAVSSPTKILYR
jgi:hypothetical protein